MYDPEKLLIKITRLSQALDLDTRSEDKYFHGVVLGLLLSAHEDRLSGAVLDRVRKSHPELLELTTQTMETLLNGTAN